MERIAKHKQWRVDVELDFAAFESNLVRAQLLLDSNERERARYAAEKVKILETAQAVKANNVKLHEQLKQAQDRLALRKSYDEMADTITSNRALKPREEQMLALEKLNNEIAELGGEKDDYARTWAERREQFGKIVEEGMQMLRLIRDEKEEADRKEGMGDLEDGDQADLRTGGSGVSTPKPAEEGHAQGGPRIEHGQALPKSTRASRQSSPRRQNGTPLPASHEVEMSHESEAVDEATGENDDGMEEGEEAEDIPGDMDTT